MIDKIPNDIFQYSLPSAYAAGLTTGGPLAAQMPAYGTHGIGRIANGSHMLFHSGKVFCVREREGTVKLATETARMPWVMVSRFEPSWERRLGNGADLKALTRMLVGCDSGGGDGNPSGMAEDAIFSGRSPHGYTNDGGGGSGKNSFMPVEIEGVFEKVEVARGEVRERFVTVHGLMFGFWIPQWAEGMAGKGLRMVFVGEGETVGGPVTDFVAKDVTVSWSKAGRVHLGLPNGPDFDDLVLEKET